MARGIITHMYWNSKRVRLIDKITGYARMFGLYKMTDACDIYSEDMSRVEGRYEVAQGFAPVVWLLSKLSDFPNTARTPIRYDAEGHIVN